MSVLRFALLASSSRIGLSAARLAEWWLRPPRRLEDVLRERGGR